MNRPAPPGSVPPPIPAAPTPGAPIPSAALSWAALYTALILDVVQVFALVGSDGFTDPLLTGAAIAAFTAELYLFSIALRRITPTIANGMLGASTAAVAVISIGWLAEPLTPVKGVALLAVITGAALLRTEGTKPASTGSRAAKNDHPPPDSGWGTRARDRSDQ